MNTRRLIFVAILGVMMVMAVVVGRKTADNLQTLKDQGFTISEDFNGQPRLLLDQHQQKIALVDGKGSVQLRFDQISDLKIAFDGQKQAPVNYRIEIFSSQFAGGKQGVVYENEWRARQEYSRFLHALGRKAE